MLNIEVKILDSRVGNSYPMLLKASGQAGAFDLVACLDNNLSIAAGEVVKIPSGLAIFIKNENYAGLILPRSGLGVKGLVLANSVGLIDADYQGPLTVACWNRSSSEIQVKPGDRIAQLLIIPILQPAFQLVKEFSVATARGEGGFGSTGGCG